MGLLALYIGRLETCNMMNALFAALAESIDPGGNDANIRN